MFKDSVFTEGSKNKLKEDLLRYHQFIISRYKNQKVGVVISGENEEEIRAMSSI